DVTVLASEPELSLMGFPAREPLVRLAHCGVALVVRIPDPSGLSGLFSARETEQLVQSRVRPHDDPILDEGDAEGGRLQTGELLPRRPPQARRRRGPLLR